MDQGVGVLMAVGDAAGRCVSVGVVVGVFVGGVVAVGGGVRTGSASIDPARRVYLIQSQHSLPELSGTLMMA
jgi:hypothetical protein